MDGSAEFTEDKLVCLCIRETTEGVGDCPGSEAEQ